MKNFQELSDNTQLYIASKVLNTPKEVLMFGFEITDKMEQIATEHILGKPLAKIFKEKYFWNWAFYTNESTLDPRPSTERIIEKIIEKHKFEDKFRFLDLGTGTGCISITILKLFPHSQCMAIDISDKALEVAKYNAENLDVIDRCTFVKNDWLEGIDESFDILVSNPPYLSNKEYEQNKRILHHEPLFALVSEDPLRMYERISEKEQLFDEIYLEVPPNRKKKIASLFERKVFLCY